MAGFNMQGKSDCLLKTLAQKPHALGPEQTHP